ncbi:hypothetical protein [Streptomyces sp. NPDC048565]|uniref:hypothetical protein n=1 Tax=Streptomyces sp. NPDC048565 TaxID=3155266 RepID=UPI003431DCBA
MKRIAVAVCTALCISAAGSAAAIAADRSAADRAGAYTVQGGCGYDYDIQISGARAGASLWCSGGKIHLDGWVRDNAADGQCAQLYGNVGSKSFEISVCGKGDEKEVHVSGTGSSANVYLRRYASGS